MTDSAALGADLATILEYFHSRETPLPVIDAFQRVIERMQSSSSNSTTTDALERLAVKVQELNHDNQKYNDYGATAAYEIVLALIRTAQSTVEGRKQT